MAKFTTEKLVTSDHTSDHPAAEPSISRNQQSSARDHLILRIPFFDSSNFILSTIEYYYWYR